MIDSIMNDIQLSIFERFNLKYQLSNIFKNAKLNTNLHDFHMKKLNSENKSCNKLLDLTDRA
jgi:hypothetical protein